MNTSGGNPQGLRARNKAATAQAIIEAALAVAIDVGFGNFTVEDVAERAGISRRTFFNYFPSVEAAIVSRQTDFLDDVIERFRKRPATEPFFISVRYALEAFTEPEHLRLNAELHSMVAQYDALARYELSLRAECVNKIAAAAEEKLGAAADPFYIRMLASAFVATSTTALDLWYDHTEGSVEPEALQLLTTLLNQGMDYIQQGFATDDSQPSSSLTHFSDSQILKEN